MSHASASRAHRTPGGSRRRTITRLCTVLAAAAALCIGVGGAAATSADARGFAGLSLNPLLGPVLDALTPLAGVPGNMSVPDLNNDGAPDVAVPDFGTDHLSVRINNGDGTFGPVHRYPVGIKPSFIAQADLNGDGNTDITVSNALSADVSVLLGNGDGTLQDARTYSISGPSAGILGVSNGTFSVDAVDVDGDGILDLVTSNSISDDLSVLPGNGDGTFGTARTYPIYGPHSIGIIPFALSTGDFNGDGFPDAVTGGATSVTIMLNDGHGNFTATSSNPVGIDIACTRTGDFDENGTTDIVATGTGTLNTMILLGDGHGKFRNAGSLFSGGVGPQCLSVADVTGDGHEDLLVVNTLGLTGQGNLAVKPGDGHGHFGGNILRTSYPVQFAPWASQVTDLDGDGVLDVVVANSVPASVSVLHGHGDGTYAKQVVYGM